MQEGASFKLDLTTAATALAVIVGGGCCVAAFNNASRTKRKQPQQQRRHDIIMYGFLPLDKYPDSSPSCIKLATFLKMCKADFEFVPYTKHQFQQTSRKKVPFVHIQSSILFASKAKGDATNQGIADNGAITNPNDDGDLGVVGAASDYTLVLDSSTIIDTLKRADPKRYDLDRHLTPKEVAIGTAFKTMIEESFYWTSIVFTRWDDKAEYERVTKPTYFAGAVPKLLWPMLDFVVRGKIVRDYRGQGMGLLERDEVLEKAKKEIRSMAEYLGGSRYFMGDKLTSYDATVYGYLAATLQGGWESGVKDELKKHVNLMDYMDRMSNEMWPELQGESAKRPKQPSS
mmetsp:Transcript_15038/g.42463  ORF Transcript_15038/g.42463 Transcript_15038/m.42463 type:complete len:344 (+) Transcript_15038:91-1122(+)|eukprot:CAMPEP_0119555604 /NCGR_PEP_ID=MMETSP1352-20130426/7761_1 /TAXON_ID=265584 /ORGANISM="Stauroneis constricta, Strain CCMP1120" /LENGTH=343 /DNA_ID=CAMNT_0007602391 /DNA_START=68 /DNA_END=1099 /DNA_ORIENTATION=+